MGGIVDARAEPSTCLVVVEIGLDCLGGDHDTMVLRVFSLVGLERVYSPHLKLFT